MRAVAAGAAPMLLGAPRLCASRAAAAAQREDDGDRLGGDMDESSLLDLLECSVCLERLDTTAKVLPCQHTFCRRCLESIVSSRRELRCPECRILVGCGVDELPANILLVRLLDGIRQRPRAGASPGSSPPARPGPGPSPASGAASALAGGGVSSPGSPILLPAATGATSSLRELATSRSTPPAKVGVPFSELCVCWGQGAVRRGRGPGVFRDGLHLVLLSRLASLHRLRRCNTPGPTCQLWGITVFPSHSLPASPCDLTSILSLWNPCAHLHLLCGLCVCVSAPPPTTWCGQDFLPLSPSSPLLDWTCFSPCNFAGPLASLNIVFFSWTPD